MQHSAVIRWQQGQLVWYPPGSSEPPHPLDSPAAIAPLQALAAARQGPLILALPGADVTLRELDYSAAERRHIGKALPFLLEQELAADIEELHFAVRPAGKLRLAVAVCSQQCMQFWQEQVAALPPLGQWLPEPLLLPWQPGQVCLLLEADYIVVRSGRNSGFAAARAMAEPLLAALAQTAEFAAVVVYGVGQTVDTALLPAAWRELVQWRRGDFGTALLLSAEQRQPLNLLQGAYAARLPLQRWWRRWRMVAALLAAALGLQLASTWASYSQLKSANLQLQQQIEGSYRELNPQGRARDYLKALQQQLTAARGSARGVGFVTLLARTGQQLQAGPGLQLTSIHFNEKSAALRLQLLAPDFAAVESLRTRLVAAGLQVQMEHSSKRDQRVRARLQVRAQ